MLIGEVAKRSGVSARMLRHYDTLGLVQPSGRTSGGYRAYSPADVERIFHVESLRSLGLSLTEVHRALDDPGFSPGALVDHLIDQSQQQLAATTELQSRLRRVQTAEPRDWREVLDVVSLLRALSSGDPRSRQRAVLSAADAEHLPADSLAQAVLAETEPNVAGAMRWALARTGAAGLAALSPGLASAEPEVRRRAVEAIADIDDAQATTLLHSALTDTDGVVRARAALAVAARGDRDAGATLIDLLVDGHRDVEAAEALGGLARTPQAAADLTSALLERARGAEPDVRRRLVQALAEIPGTAARQAITGFNRDPDPSVARTAEAISRQGSPRGPAQ